jgi:hypothetical protein
MFYWAETIDDLLREVLGEIISKGHPVTASRGSNRELSCVLLKLKRSRARLRAYPNNSRGGITP